MGGAPESTSSLRLLAHCPDDNAHTLRIFFEQAGGGVPGAPVVDVRVLEAVKQITVLVLEGPSVGGKLASNYGWTRIRLNEPLGDRAVIDGSTERSIHCVERTAQSGTRDWFLLKAPERRSASRPT